jgi:ring-1,2-phenylacetyl-CoA epoxidase subunit PaaC
MPSLPSYEKDVLDQAKRAPDRGAFDEEAEAGSDPLEDAYFSYLVRLGDDSLVLGQRLGEWCGHAPVLEVDLSLTNLALDLIGQATHLLGHANNDDADELAFHRDVLDFKNCLLVEQPNGDFARTIARQLLFSTWQHMLYRDLADSPDKFLREFAAKAVKEVAYHREERAADGRGTRLVLALCPRIVRGRRLPGGDDRAPDGARSPHVRNRILQCDRGRAG